MSSMRYRRFEDPNFGNRLQAEVIGGRKMFLILVVSSFLETAVPVYTRNLTAYFKDDEEISNWLSQHWLPEEIEHGRAVQTYIHAVWPEFDWKSAYARFYREFEPYCSNERYQPTKALEMLARCVTETGAATFYKVLRDSTKEPILREVLDQMQRDEIRHYKYFLRFFRFYNQQAAHSNLRIIETILRRGLRVYNEDAFIAYKHAYESWRGIGSFSPTLYRSFIREVRQIVREFYPCEQAIKMLSRPLESRDTRGRVFGSLVSRAVRFSW